MNPPHEPSDRPDTPLLDSVYGPQDVRLLEPGRVPGLAAEIRDFLVASVPCADGRLDANLGAVELAIALHRVFDSPRDAVLWDTGHQSWAHRLVTGRKDIGRPDRGDGPAGGGSARAASRHDPIETSRASTVLSYADGLAKAYRIAGRDDRHVVVVVGDGALAGGMAWEALNSIAAAGDLRLVVVVNDDGGSEGPVRGALAGHLATLRTRRGFERFLDTGQEILRRTPVVGGPLQGALRGAKKGLHQLVASQGLFEDLGLRYLGPVDGHSVPDLEQALRLAKDGGPVVVHCVTRRGKGAPRRPAEAEGTARHGGAPVLSAFGPADGRPRPQPWEAVFAEEMVKTGADRPDVVAVTAGVPRPVGLGPFADTFPERFFDVGAAERHAVTSAAGLATGGLHPVVTVHPAFLDQALEQVRSDVAPLGLGVTLVLGAADADAAGEDGLGRAGLGPFFRIRPASADRASWPTRAGSGACSCKAEEGVEAERRRPTTTPQMCVPGPATPARSGRQALGDGAPCRLLPGLRLAVPRDGARLRAQLRQALEVSDAPTAVWFPPGDTGPDIDAVAYDGGVDVLRRGRGRDVLVVSVGAMAPACLEAARLLEAEGVCATVVDPCWVQPLDAALPRLAAGHRLVVTAADGGPGGGVEAALLQELNDARAAVPVLRTAPGPTGADIAHAVLGRLRDGT